jgi:uncharacterized protein
MLDEQLSFLLNGVYVAQTAGMGRGVFTSKSIRAGKLIELAPVIVMSEADRTLLDQTRLHDYIFEWGEDEKKCIVALGLISVYNHSYKANCNYGMYFQQEAISIVSVRDIKAGEELFINYNGTWNDDKKVWFDTK